MRHGYQLTLMLMLALAGCTTPSRSLTGKAPALGKTPSLTAPSTLGGGNANGSGLLPTNPLAGSGSIIGKLKSAPAGLIANNDAILLSDMASGLIANNSGGLIANNGGGVIANNSGNLTASKQGFRLLALDEVPLGGAKVRLVDATGQPLTDEVATSDAAGNFTLSVRPKDLSAALVQATFEAAGKSLEYLAVPPASGTVDLDTASTLAAARWRVELRAGRKSAPPGQNLIARLRFLLEPGTVPYFGTGTRDVADTFDQLMADDATLRDAAASDAPNLIAPARSWQVEPWYTEESLRAAGALDADTQFTRGEASVFVVDGKGLPYMVVAGTPDRIIRLSESGQAETLVNMPDTSKGPYSLVFSPSKQLYVLHSDVNRHWIVERFENGKLTQISNVDGGAANRPSNLHHRIAATNSGVVYSPMPDKHCIAVFRPGASSIEVFAGKPFTPGYQDGAGTEARFNTPVAISAAPDGRVYVADKENQCIRRIDPKGNVVTVVGKPGDTASRFGRGTYARLGEPNSIVVAADGTMFATDVGGRRAVVFRLSPDGSVFRVAGGPVLGNVDGPGPQARFNRPSNLDIDDNGNLYLQDISEIRNQTPVLVLRKVSATALPNTTP